ncbi:Protein TOXD [Lachnellula hyalina]|uniref:Protein TOXD n=1 Tax=Lachnellula hyalina TaxID=1316788 RepID=A0A8H8R7R7_9HELO|nr:Protein TOXD [Lachnellula hyalina]TVY29255.1 Protein TOXD [Lachnellula hyalina]
MTTKHQNRGLVKQGKNDAAVINLPYPKLRDDFIQVKTIAVALNPADWQDLEEQELKPGSPPLLIGCDYSGIVEAIGKDVSKDLKIGDRVMGFAHGTNVDNHEDGTFAEHITAKGDLTIRIPPSLSFTDVATVPCGVGTAALALYRHLGLPLLPETVAGSPWILVYGGSSASGSIAIQFAKLSGLKVVTTCSPRNFDFVRGLGADAVFDYRDPGCTRQIRELTSDTLKLVLDTIATSETAEVSTQAMSSSKGGIYCNLMGVDSPRKDVKAVFFLGYTGLGETYTFLGEEWPVVPEDYELVKKVLALSEGLLEDGKIKPHPAAVRPGGLGGILSGMMDLKNKKISGEKLVYVIGKED